MSYRVCISVYQIWAMSCRSQTRQRFHCDKGYDIQFGARPLKRAIQKYLEDEMAEMIIRASVGEGDTIIVDFDKEEQKITTSIKERC